MLPGPGPGPGRPRTLRSVRALVRENSGWGYRRVHGELLVLGVKVAPSTVWDLEGGRDRSRDLVMDLQNVGCRIWDQRHLLRALREFEAFCNHRRPHQAIANARPLRPLPPPITDPSQIARLGTRRRQRLGGILNEYDRAA